MSPSRTPTSSQPSSPRNSSVTTHESTDNTAPTRAEPFATLERTQATEKKKTPTCHCYRLDLPNPKEAALLGIGHALSTVSRPMVHVVATDIAVALTLRSPWEQQPLVITGSFALLLSALGETLIGQGIANKSTRALEEKFISKNPNDSEIIVQDPTLQTYFFTWSLVFLGHTLVPFLDLILKLGIFPIVACNEANNETEILNKSWYNETLFCNNTFTVNGGEEDAFVLDLYTLAVVTASVLNIPTEVLLLSLFAALLASRFSPSEHNTKGRHALARVTRAELYLDCKHWILSIFQTLLSSMQKISLDFTLLILTLLPLFEVSAWGGCLPVLILCSLFLGPLHAQIAFRRDKISKTKIRNELSPALILDSREFKTPKEKWLEQMIRGCYTSSSLARALSTAGFYILFLSCAPQVLQEGVSISRDLGYILAILGLSADFTTSLLTSLARTENIPHHILRAENPRASV